MFTRILDLELFLFNYNEIRHRILVYRHDLAYIFGGNEYSFKKIRKEYIRKNAYILQKYLKSNSFLVDDGCDSFLSLM